jgi:ribosomal protein S27E
LTEAGSFADTEARVSQIACFVLADSAGRLVEQHYPSFREMCATAGRSLPNCIEDEFDACLKCGRLEKGFLRVRCEHCHAEKLVAFSCKKRGFCPSCGARRMADTAALRFLLATDPAATSAARRWRWIAWHSPHQGRCATP